MSLRMILEETVAASVNRIPPEALEIIMKSAIELDAQGVGGNALRPGDKLPDATLVNAQNKPISIGSLLAKGPLVINYYRGGWCPYCNFELKAYQTLLPEIKAMGAQLVAITPESSDSSMSTIEKNALEFPVLTDKALTFANTLGIAFELPLALQQVYAGFGMDLPTINADTGWTLPIPAVFVVKRNGEIALSHVDRDYTKRLEPSDALAALRNL